MSKGSVQRPDDGKYGEGWDRIFGKNERMKQLDEEQGQPRPLPDYGDLFSLREFIAACIYGSFVDDDGSGYYSDGMNYFRLREARPSDIMTGVINRDYSHVMWFNK